jgi:YbgC/YbaW family acyl-CoA thioester hydrolase
MPLIHTRTFRVRSYECDAYGNLNNTNYLRFMQETAFDASAAAGYDLKRYAEMERLWLIHQTDVEYLCHLHYNDRVEVKTWIADFRRISSRRGYEFRLAVTDQLVAQAHTDWVFLDSVINQPATIPKTLALDFYPEGLPETYPARKPFPKAPPPPPGVFRTHRKVEWGDLDTRQHVNNAIYLVVSHSDIDG